MRNAPYAKSDQAEGLRRLCGRQSRQLVSVAAATSGAGRTAFILHVAVALATLGRRVLIIDENKGLGNVNDVLGLGLRYDLAHAIAGDRDMREICRPALVGIKLLPAAQVARDPALVEGPRCSELLAAAAADADVVLVDTAAASAGRRWPLYGEHSHLVMVPAGAEAVTAAYGFIKQHAQNVWHPPLGIVVSRVASVAQGEAIHANLSDVAKRFLARPLPLAGVWGSDLAVPLALRARQTVNATDVEHAVSRRCADIANQLIGGAPNVAPSLPVPWLARLLRAAPSSTAWSAT